MRVRAYTDRHKCTNTLQLCWKVLKKSGTVLKVKVCNILSVRMSPISKITLIFKEKTCPGINGVYRIFLRQLVMKYVFFYCLITKMKYFDWNLSH